jgi:hypothetical protein
MLNSETLSFMDMSKLNGCPIPPAPPLTQTLNFASLPVLPCRRHAEAPWMPE